MIVAFRQDAFAPSGPPRPPPLSCGTAADNQDVGVGKYRNIASRLGDGAKAPTLAALKLGTGVENALIICVFSSIGRPYFVVPWHRCLANGVAAASGRSRRSTPRNRQSPAQPVDR